jgi:hypothetical protein
MSDLDQEFESATDLDAEFDAAPDMAAAAQPVTQADVIASKTAADQSMQQAADIPDSTLGYMAQSAGRYLGDMVTGNAPVQIPVVSPILDKFRSPEELAFRKNYQEQHPERAAAGDILTGALVGGGVGKAAQAVAPLAGLGAGGTALVEAGVNVAGNRALTAADVAAQGGNMEDIQASQSGLAAGAIDAASLAIPGLRAAAPYVASRITGKAVKDVSQYADDMARYDNALSVEDVHTRAAEEAAKAADNTLGIEKELNSVQAQLPELRREAAESLSNELGSLPEKFGQLRDQRSNAAAEFSITPEQLSEIQLSLLPYYENPRTSALVQKFFPEPGTNPAMFQPELTQKDLVNTATRVGDIAETSGGYGNPKTKQLYSLIQQLRQHSPEPVQQIHGQIKDMANAQQFLKTQAGQRNLNVNSLQANEQVHRNLDKIIDSESGNLDKSLSMLGADELRDILASYKGTKTKADELLAKLKQSTIEQKSAEVFSNQIPALTKKAFSADPSVYIEGSAQAVAQQEAMNKLSKLVPIDQLQDARIRSVMETPNSPRGSRLVNLGSNLGGLFGPAGRAVGATVGAAADYAGGKALVKSSAAIDAATRTPLAGSSAAQQAQKRDLMDLYLQQKYPDRYNKAKTPGDIDKARAESDFLEQDNPSTRGSYE